MGSAGRRRYDDDDDDRSTENEGGKGPLIGFAIGGAALLLMMCVCGGTVVGVVMYTRGGTQPDQFVGAWKGRFILHGQPTDVIYRFDKSGRLHEENFDVQGRSLGVTGGRWRVRNGRMEIDFDTGGQEIADAVFTDKNTIDYRIVSHTDFAQIGIGTTFRRQ